MLDAAEDADAFGETRIDHAAEQIRKARLLGALIVNQEVACRDAMAQGHDLGIQAMQPNALVAVLAEDQRLAVFQMQRIVRLDALIGGVLEDAVVENLAILVDLDKRRALVSRGPPQRFRE